MMTEKKLTPGQRESLRKTDVVVINDYIIPSGFVTAEDYGFWSPTWGESTLAERKVRAAELNILIDIVASPTQYFLAADKLKAEVDIKEAEERGIKTDGYLWERALAHARAVEVAASMSEKDYINTERQPGTNLLWPRWYKDSNKKRAYANLVKESKTDYYGKRSVEDGQDD
jgi:hypothetical protein